MVRRMPRRYWNAGRVLPCACIAPKRMPIAVGFAAFFLRTITVKSYALARVKFTLSFVAMHFSI